MMTYYDIIVQMRDYKVGNEIINNIWIKAQLDNSLIVMLKGKKNWNPSKDDYDTNFWKQGPFQNIQKSITFIGLKFF